MYTMCLIFVIRLFRFVYLLYVPWYSSTHKIKWSIQVADLVKPKHSAGRIVLTSSTQVRVYI